MNKILHTKAVIDKANVTEAGVIDTIIGSSAVVDRMGDIIDQGGWNLKNFLANPVILWGHNVKEEKPPIGKALKVWVEDKGSKNARLMFKVQFDLADQFAAEIYRKIKDGFLNTVSVGFMPTEWEELDPDNWFGGLKYVKQELLELSIVPVPANPEATIQLNSFAKEDKRLAPVEEKDMFAQVKDNRYNKMIKESNEVPLEKVLEEKENEIKVDLLDIKDFYPESFRALPMKKEDKEYVVIVGKLKDSGAFVEQSFRYSKNNWTEEEVKALSGEQDEEVTAEEEVVNDPEPEEVVEEKVDDEEVVIEDPSSEEDTTDDTEETEVIKTADIKKIESALDAITKSGRVISSKNESKIRQALALLAEVLGALETDDEEEEKDDGTTTGGHENDFAKAIEYQNLGTLPELESWSVSGEVAKATKEDLLLMAAYVDSEGTEDKTAYKLVHHKADSDHKAVWRGVASSMALLMGAKGGVEIDEAEKKAVYDHLVKHYEEFNKKAPEFKLIEDQVFADMDEEVMALTLEREEKHAVRLLKKILDNQKEEKKEKVEKPEVVVNVTEDQTFKALEVISQALSKIKVLEGGEN